MKLAIRKALTIFSTATIAAILGITCVGTPVQASSRKYNPGLQLTRVCTFVTSPTGTKLSNYEVIGRFDNSASLRTVRYKAMLIDDNGELVRDTIDDAYVKAGKRSTAFGTPPNPISARDHWVNLAVEAHGISIYYSFSRESVCGSYYAHATSNATLRFKYTSTCLARWYTKSTDWPCVSTTNSVKIKNLGQKSATIVMSTAAGNDAEGIAPKTGPKKSITLKAGESSDTMSLIKYNGGKCEAYLGKCRKKIGTYYKVDITSNGKNISGIQWSGYIHPWDAVYVTEDV